MRVSGYQALNVLYQIVKAAVNGLGIAFVPEDAVRQHIYEGRLVTVMRDWCPTYTGFHLYYPSRHQSSRAMVLLVEALRQK